MVDDRAEEAITDLDDTGKLPVISADAEPSEALPDDFEPAQAEAATTAQDSAADADGATDTDADGASDTDEDGARDAGDAADIDADGAAGTDADGAADAQGEEDAAAQAADNADAGAGVATDADEGEQTSEFREIPKVAMRGRKSPLPVIGIAVAILLAVGGLVAAILLLPGYGGRGADDASAQSAQDGKSARAMARTDVTIPIAVPGLDEKGSRVSLRATGTDVDGNKFSEVQYVSHEGVGMTLPVGSYEVHVAESPISAQGIMYDLPLEGIKVSVYAGGNVSFEPKDATLELTPTHPESINDGKIEAARKMILADPQKKDLASKLAKLVVERRKKAVAFLADKRKEMRSREDEHEEDEDEDEHEEKDKDDDSDNKDSGNGSKPNNSGSKSQSKESGSAGKDDSGSKDEGEANSGGGEQQNSSDSHADSGGGGEQQQSGGADAGGGESGDTGGDAGGDAGGGTSEPAPQPEPSAGGETGGEQPTEG